MRIKLLVGLVGLMMAAQIHAATRVALVSLCHDEASENLSALSAVLVSQETGLVVVERRDIEKVLGEQQKGACGLMDSRQAVTVGKLLGAELFVVLESSLNPKEGGSLVVYEAGTGVRLLDEMLPVGNVESVAAAVVAGVHRSETKRLQRVGGMLTLGLAAVRNADLPSELNSWCSSVGLLVERQMVHATNLAVLERKRLENVNQERNLPTTQASQQLLASLVTLELEFGKDPEAVSGKGVVAKALLTDAAGKRLATLSATGTKESGAQLAKQLSDQILKTLNGGEVQVTAGDVKLEAQRFLRETSFLDDQNDPEGALQASEAAGALDPKNINIIRDLTLRLGKWAALHQRTAADLDQTIGVARRAHELWSERGEVLLLSAFKEHLDFFSNPTEMQLINGYLWGQVWPLCEKGDAKALRVFQEFQQELRENQLKMMCWTFERNLVADTDTASEPAAKEKGKHLKKTSSWYMDSNETCCGLVKYSLYTSSSRQWTEDVIQVLRLYLLGLEHNPVFDDWSAYSVRMLMHLAMQASGQAPIDHLGRWQLQPPDLGKLRELFEEMTHNADPVAQCYGRIGLFGLTLRGQTGPLDGAGQRRYEELREFIRQTIANPYRPDFPDKHSKDMAVRNAYYAARDAIDLVPDMEFQKREHLALFDWMLQRNDVDGGTALVVCIAKVNRFFNYGRRLEAYEGGGINNNDFEFPQQDVRFTEAEQRQKLANIERALAVFKQPNRRFTAKIGSDGGKFDMQMAILRQTLLKMFPDAVAQRAAPWTNKKLLYEAGNFAYLGGGRVFENAAYALQFGRGLSVVRISLNGAGSEIIGSTPKTPTKLSSLNVNDGQCCLGTGDGLYVFPVNGGESTLITQADGLPTTSVTGGTYVGGNVFAGLEGGYLVRYNLASKNCTVLASARRRDKQSPLDDITPAYKVTQMLNDPARHRVLFLVNFPSGTYNVPPMGLWQLDTETGAIQQLYQFYMHPSWMHFQSDGRLLIHFESEEGLSLHDDPKHTPWMGVVRLDCATDQAEVILSWSGRDAGPNLPCPKAAATKKVHLSYPLLLTGDWLWCLDSDVWQFGRLSLTSKTMEYLPMMDQRRSDELVSGWHAVGWHPIIGTQQVVAFDNKKVWLLTLPPTTN